MESLRRRPIGMVRPPLTAAGDSASIEACLFVGNDPHPGVAAGDQRLDFGQRQILCQLDGQRLGMAAHGARPAHICLRSAPGGLPVPRSCWLRRPPSIPRGSDRCPNPCRSTESGCRRAAPRIAARKLRARQSRAHRSIDLQNAGSGILQQRRRRAVHAPICSSISRMYCAPAPEADW